MSSITLAALGVGSNMNEKERMQQVNALTHQLLRECQKWAEAQVAVGREQINVLAEVTTASLQAGMIMCARMGLPAEKVHKMYAAEQQFAAEEHAKLHPDCKDCAHTTNATAITGTPDRKAN